MLLYGRPTSGDLLAVYGKKSSSVRTNVRTAQLKTLGLQGCGVVG